MRLSPQILASLNNLFARLTTVTHDACHSPSRPPSPLSCKLYFRHAWSVAVFAGNSIKHNHSTSSPFDNNHNYFSLSLITNSPTMPLFKRKNRDLADADVVGDEPPKEKVKWSKRPASEYSGDGAPTIEPRRQQRRQWQCRQTTDSQTRRSSSSASRHGSRS